MLGQKFYKKEDGTVEGITLEVAEWCNNNNASIVDKGEYYEIVERTPIEPLPIVATWQDKIEAQVMYTALITDSLIEEGEE